MLEHTFSNPSGPSHYALGFMLSQLWRILSLSMRQCRHCWWCCCCRWWWDDDDDDDDDDYDDDDDGDHDDDDNDDDDDDDDDESNRMANMTVLTVFCFNGQQN